MVFIFDKSRNSVIWNDSLNSASWHWLVIWHYPLLYSLFFFSSLFSFHFGWYLSFFCKLHVKTKRCFITVNAFHHSISVGIWKDLENTFACRKYDSNALILQTSAIIMNFFFNNFFLGYSKHAISLNFYTIIQIHD